MLDRPAVARVALHRNQLLAEAGAGHNGNLTRPAIAASSHGFPDIREKPVANLGETIEQCRRLIGSTHDLEIASKLRAMSGATEEERLLGEVVRVLLPDIIAVRSEMPDSGPITR